MPPSEDGTCWHILKSGTRIRAILTVPRQGAGSFSAQTLELREKMNGTSD